MRNAILMLVLTGCTSTTDVQWLEGFSFGWRAFNHRLSYVGVEVDGGSADVTVVGGTSTTGVRTELTPECDPDESEDALPCDEFPFLDSAFVDVLTGRAELKGASGIATGALVVGVAGATTTVDVPLDGKAKGSVVALIHGLTLDTDEALENGPACYDPANGWHPRRIQVALSEPVLGDDGRSASVDVTAAFEAGNSLEEVRQCIDAVATEARVAMTVTVQVVAAKGDVSTQSLDQSGAWAINVDQPLPTAAERPLDVPSDGVVGWSSIDYRFHVDDPEDRGAYLRTWAFIADPVGGLASGHATNTSPGTQLSGFDYTFSGTVTALSTGDDVTRRIATDEIEIELDESGYVPVSLDLGPR